MGKWKLVIRASLRRLNCPAHGVLVEQVPFARHRSGLTRDFEDLVAYFATKTDKTAITRILRIDWDTVGRACERVVADGLDPCRLEGLVNIGVDEVSWRKHHRYLTLVTDHAAGKIVWGAEGKDTATLDAFFDDLGSEKAAALQAVSMDMGPAFAKSVTAPGHAPQAVICIDPFHAVKLAGDALDVLRRQTWNELRQL
ncbi:MAG: DDE transposase, partial [Betaproteobacteria bacterium]|nr:DDE transposase [Betaproteobacteria bacterium]